MSPPDRKSVPPSRCTSAIPYNLNNITDGKSIAYAVIKIPVPSHTRYPYVGSFCVWGRERQH